ncbi:MAG: hypothetical protein WC554_11500, partial [Clostridia bacterium]
MEKDQILNFLNTGLEYKDIEQIKEKYEISFGKYEAHEIRDCIKAQNPVLLKDNRLIVGAFPDGKFVDQNGKKFNIERVVDGIVLNKALNDDIIEESSDLLVIPGRWDVHPDDRYHAIIEPLQIGPSFLPPHSVIINFLNPSESQIKDKLQSELDGVNINVYSIAKDYIGNIFHELGHLIWRTKLTYDEKQAFNAMSKRILCSSIYEYDWEKKNGEEIFCTIYKWYLKSIYINKSFYNILIHEEPHGLDFLQAALNRMSNSSIVFGIWNLQKASVLDYLNPKFDTNSGKYIRKKGTFYKNIIIPNEILSDIDSIRNGITYVNLSKSVKVPVKNNKIDWDNVELKPMNKAFANYYGNSRRLFMDQDGVLADFVGHYKAVFNRDAYKDDPFTVQQFCKTEPNFFRGIPVLERGRKLYEALKDKYTIAVLTHPMPEMTFCKYDKALWLKEHFPEIKTVIFSGEKYEYAVSEESVLIDDMESNLMPWADAGGTAIDFTKLSNDKIIDKIDAIFNPKEKIKIIGKTDVNPSEKEKESGNYKKGTITYKGLNIKIENPAGSIRFGFGQDGKKWITRMNSHYGYFVNGEDGNDGDKVDCFVNPKGSGSRVFVVNQIDPLSGLFD